jgi:hypothetical protein
LFEIAHTLEFSLAKTEEGYEWQLHQFCLPFGCYLDALLWDCKEHPRQCHFPLDEELQQVGEVLSIMTEYQGIE